MKGYAVSSALTRLTVERDQDASAECPKTSWKKARWSSASSVVAKDVHLETDN